MLADYAKPGVSVAFVEPFATRLLRLLDYFNGRVELESGFRSYEEQVELYRRYLAGGNLAAKPGTSNHERGEAADLDRVDMGLTWFEVHTEAAARGLCFPVTGEPWHCEADPAYIDPTPEDDMTLDQLAQAFGGALDNEGRIVVPLADGNLYPLGNVLGFIHQEITTDASLPARIKRVLSA